MGDDRMKLLRGTLDLLILRSLAWGRLHGYAIASWLESATNGTLLLEEGTLYPALHRLERRGWVKAEWGLSENRRRARFYSLTPKGREQAEAEARGWERYAEAVAMALDPSAPAPRTAD